MSDEAIHGSQDSGDNEICLLRGRMKTLKEQLDTLSTLNIELSGIKSLMDKSMLSKTQLSELEVSLHDSEQEKFTVSDNLKSREHKLREITKKM